MIELFVSGGVLWMTILTLELVCLLLAAFKAPRWVSSIGDIALYTVLLNTLLRLFNVFTVLQLTADISPLLIFGGCSSSLIGIIYGVSIFVISRIIKIIHSPSM